MTTQDDVTVNGPRGGVGPWLLLLIAIVWAAALRAPLVLNAADHMDSDLAVDGLTLLDATRGHWRWHYPGTPFMGIGPVFLSLPQALFWGVTPETLVSGGVVAFVGLMLATFLLGRGAFGGSVAAWSLAPLAFSSAGAVWLSGRLTGGHLLAAAWHAGAFALLAGALAKGGTVRAAALGLWCGCGLYLDSMFAVTILGLLSAAFGSWLAAGRSKSQVSTALIAALAFVAGVWPRPLGAKLDPYDAYQDQFAIVSRPEVLADHATLLALECFPRLVAGHRLPGLETDPDPASLAGRPPSRNRPAFDGSAVVVVGLIGLLGLASVCGGARALAVGPSPGRAIAWGLLVSSAATAVGFMINRNIFNSDNYRYLVGMLVPWSLGFGLAADRLARRGRTTRVAVSLFVVVLGLGMTADVGRWYARFKWIDAQGRPTRKPVHDPALVWLDNHLTVNWLIGGYWDVYRLSFLTGGRVRGQPFSIYPDRFPDWAPPAGDQRVTLTRPTPEGAAFREKALRDGERVVYQGRGLTILARP